MSALARCRGLRLKHEREKRNLTLRELAKKFHVQHAALSEVEQGRREPWPGLTQKLANLYGVTTKTIYKWYLGTVFVHRRPALIGNAKLKFYDYPTTSDLDARCVSIVEHVEEL